jgi:hypothetical protein
MPAKHEVHPKLHLGALAVFGVAMAALALPTIRDIGWGFGMLMYAEYQDMIYFWDHWDTVKATLGFVALVGLLIAAATVPAYRSRTKYFND